MTKEDKKEYIYVWSLIVHVFRVFPCLSLFVPPNPCFVPSLWGHNWFTAELYLQTIHVNFVLIQN